MKPNSGKSGNMGSTKSRGQRAVDADVIRRGL